jgi:hypothetical protein
MYARVIACILGSVGITLAYNSNHLCPSRSRPCETLPTLYHMTRYANEGAQSGGPCPPSLIALECSGEFILIHTVTPYYTICMLDNNSVDLVYNIIYVTIYNYY